MTSSSSSSSAESPASLIRISGSYPLRKQHSQPASGDGSSGRDNGAAVHNPRPTYHELLAKCLEELAVNAAEPAVGHQHDDVAVPAFTDDRRDDVVDLGNVPGMATLAREVVHQLLRREPLRLGKARSKAG